MNLLTITTITTIATILLHLGTHTAALVTALFFLCSRNGKKSKVVRGKKKKKGMRTSLKHRGVSRNTRIPRQLLPSLHLSISPSLHLTNPILLTG